MSHILGNSHSFWIESHHDADSWMIRCQLKAACRRFALSGQLGHCFLSSTLTCEKVLVNIGPSTESKKAELGAGLHPYFVYTAVNYLPPDYASL